MSQQWVPPDITQICSEQQASLTQCSQIGIMYLALLTRLYGSNNTNNPIAKGQVEATFPINITYPIQIAIRSRIESSNLAPPTSRLQTNQSNVHPFTTFLGQGKDSASPVSMTPSVEINLGRVLLNISTNYGSTTVSPKGSSGSFYVKKSFGDVKTSDFKVKEEEKTTEGGKTKCRRGVETYDFIIVGAGSAGCVVANRLSEVNNCKILLLEAGPEEPEITSVPGLAPVLASSSVDWSYKTQPEQFSCRSQKGQSCPWIKGKMMGGCSALNYMVYMRGNRRVYNDWPALGNHGWSYPEVLPYFKKAENNRDIEARDKLYHSVGGPLNVERFSRNDVDAQMLVQAFEQNGLPITDFNGENQLGTEIAQSTSYNGRRVSINTAYIKPIRNDRPNLKIITNAFATKILINSNTKTAIGVQYVKDKVTYKVYAKKEVIVSCGTGNSPKLLMLSGIGPKQHLESLGITVLSDLSGDRSFTTTSLYD